MSYIDVLISNQKFCPEIINSSRTDTKDTYTLNGEDYGTRALGRYLGLDTLEWKTNPPYIQLTTEKFVGKTLFHFQTGNFGTRWFINEDNQEREEARERE